MINKSIKKYNEEEEEDNSIKRPEKLPFSDIDLSSMTSEQISLLGLNNSEIKEYLKKKIEKKEKEILATPISSQQQQQQQQFEQQDNDDLFFTSLRKKPQTLFKHYSPKRIEDSSKSLSSPLSTKLTPSSKISSTDEKKESFFGNSFFNFLNFFFFNQIMKVQ